MNKLLLSTALLASFCVGANALEKSFTENFNKAASSTFKLFEPKIVKTMPLESIKGLNIVVAQDDKTGLYYSFFANDDATAVLNYTTYNFFANTADKKAYLEAKSLVNTKIQATYDRIALRVVSTLPQDNYISLKSDAQDAKTIYMVIDPECPYCETEIPKLKEALQKSNIKIILAPVHGHSAFVKSALVMNEAKTAKNSDEVIEILAKYFNPKVQIAPSLMEKTDVSMINMNANAVFSSGAIKMVPFITISDQ